MQLTRRHVIASTAAAAATLIGLRAMPVSASTQEALERVADFAGGVSPEPGPLRLMVPEAVEDGNLVPVSVSVESPMTVEDHVEAVAIFADDNPNPEVIVYNFTPLSGAAAASTRMRLARSQNVIAVARTSTGQVFIDQHPVEVTIGGCGA
ncbi:MAG: thiosulfate oxidation carrier protein SoxY [Paracoccaceae bacterium]|nr:thiosulfate oxidation carrier protein SoxY [Paracoccaceae bacterium]